MAKIQPTVRYFKIKSKEGAKIVSVYWSQNEKFTPILKNGEVVDYKNSQVRNYICNNEDGFLHIHTRQMYGEKVKVSVFERDRIGDDAFIISRDVLILDNRACVVFSMQELLPILYSSRKAWLEGDNFDLVAVVEPANKWIRKKESTAPLYLKIEKRSYTPAKSTAEGTRKFVPGNVKEETKEETKEKGKHDGIDIHMYADGTIEKCIPKEITNKVNYYYHDSGNKEYFIKQLEFKVASWRESAGAEKKKGVDGKYLDYWQLIDFRDLKEYSSGDVKFKIIEGSLESKRYYVDIEAFAVLIAALIDGQIMDLVCSGYSTSDGNTAGGSSNHLNGMIGDLGYFSTQKDGKSTHLFTDQKTKKMNECFDYDREVKFINRLYKLGYSQYQRLMLSEKFARNSKEEILPHCQHYATDSVRHYHHLHIQGFKTSLIKVKSK